MRSAREETLFQALKAATDAMIKEIRATVQTEDLGG